MLTFQAGASHTGTYPLDDQAALQFCDTTDDDHDGPAQRPAGVDLLPEGDELDVQPVEFVQHFQEVTSRASDTITRPDQNYIEPAAAGIGHHLIEPWPTGLDSGNPVCVLMHDLEAALGSQLAKVEELSFGMLVDSAYSHVESCALHGRLQGYHTYLRYIGESRTQPGSGHLFSVYSPSGIPTGIFNLTLATLVDVSLLTIDIAAMSSLPNIAVSVSGNGLTWTPATTVALNGSRLNAWIPETPVKYIQVVITPTHPNNLGGSTYTFGITDLSGSSVDYNLVSDVFFEPLAFPVQSTEVQLVASQDDGLTYYLTLDDGTDSPVTAVVTPETRSLPAAYINFPRARERGRSPAPTSHRPAGKHVPAPVHLFEPAPGPHPASIYMRRRSGMQARCWILPAPEAR